MERKHFSEKELKEYAEKQAETIEVRTWVNGNSYDNRRDSTEQEKKVITNIIFGALLAINSGANKQSAMDTAEYTGNLLMRDIVTSGEMNGYGTIYIPIGNFNFE